jgi:hypothetical protein
MSLSRAWPAWVFSGFIVVLIWYAIFCRFIGRGRTSRALGVGSSIQLIDPRFYLPTRSLLRLGAGLIDGPCSLHVFN